MSEVGKAGHREAEASESGALVRGNAPCRWTVRSLWVGPALSEMEWVCLKSFIRHGAQVELYTDDPARMVPCGVILRDCRELLGNAVPRYGPRAGVGAGSFALAANIARLTALHREGGWWVDTDVLCLKEFLPLDQGTKLGWESTSGGVDGRGAVNVAVMRLERNSRLATLLLRRARRPWLGSPWESLAVRAKNALKLWDTVFRPNNVPWSWSCGPNAVTSAIDYFGLRDQLLPVNTFYPFHWRAWREILSLSAEDIDALTQESYALHLWAEMYRRDGLDKGEAIRNAAWARQYLSDFP